MEARIKIRRAKLSDHDSIWLIIEQVISAGDTYIFAPDSDRKKMLEYWCGSDKKTYVAEIENQIVGTYALVVFRIPTGKTIRIEDVIVDEPRRGEGIGKAMMNHAMRIARNAGIDKIAQYEIGNPIVAGKGN